MPRKLQYNQIYLLISEHRKNCSWQAQLPPVHSPLRHWLSRSPMMLGCHSWFSWPTLVLTQLYWYLFLQLWEYLHQPSLFWGTMFMMQCLLLWSQWHSITIITNGLIPKGLVKPIPFAIMYFLLSKSFYVPTPKITLIIHLSQVSFVLLSHTI